MKSTSLGLKALFLFVIAALLLSACGGATAPTAPAIDPSATYVYLDPELQTLYEASDHLKNATEVEAMVYWCQRYCGAGEYQYAREFQRNNPDVKYASAGAIAALRNPYLLAALAVAWYGESTIMALHADQVATLQIPTTALVEVPEDVKILVYSAPMAAQVIAETAAMEVPTAEAIMAAEAATFPGPMGTALTTALVLQGGNTCDSNNKFELPFSTGLEVFKGEVRGPCDPWGHHNALFIVYQQLETKLQELVSSGAPAADIEMARKGLIFIGKLMDNMAALAELGGFVKWIVGQ